MTRLLNDNSSIVRKRKIMRDHRSILDQIDSKRDIQLVQKEVEEKVESIPSRSIVKPLSYTQINQEAKEVN